MQESIQQQTNITWLQSNKSSTGFNINLLKTTARRGKQRPHQGLNPLPLWSLYLFLAEVEQEEGRAAAEDGAEEEQGEGVGGRRGVITVLALGTTVMIHLFPSALIRQTGERMLAHLSHTSLWYVTVCSHSISSVVRSPPGH